MYDGQSLGLGTRLGDQQYVYGTFSDSIMPAASMAPTCSSVRVFSRQSLIMSPNLYKDVLGQQKSQTKEP